MIKEKPKFNIKVGQIYRYYRPGIVRPVHVLIIRKPMGGRYNCIILTSVDGVNCTILHGLTDGKKVSKFLEEHNGELVASIDKIVEFLEAN
jgi:hypothetical protein